MEKLIDTHGQSFYYATLEGFVDNIGDKNKCAIILAHDDWSVFFEKASHLLGESINQVIVIGKNVNQLHAKTKDIRNVFIISAISLKDATQIALNSSSFSKNVVYISSISSGQSISDLLSLIVE
ncbi:MAG TPA: hypothetical protein PK649_03785 [Vicingus sp.]|mgnify:CR=1 FL=1|jgi:hypothetical protein|nr:hypothetical protein [Vicingus sp.]